MFLVLDVVNKLGVALLSSPAVVALLQQAMNTTSPRAGTSLRLFFLPIYLTPLFSVNKHWVETIPPKQL